MDPVRSAAEADVPPRRRRTRRGDPIVAVHPPGTIPVDRFRNVVFPNHIRERRIERGQLKLLPFAATLRDIPYIRLSKIERGEVFARADELVRIAAALEVPPTALLLDMDAPDFDIERWYAPFAEGAASDDETEARMALLLAAAMRHRRATDPRLSAPRLDRDYDIPPVILSRIENAQKGLDRWNRQTLDSLCRLFEVADDAALRKQLVAWHEQGVLEPYLASIGGPQRRHERSRQRIAALRQELARLSDGTPGAFPVDAAPGQLPPPVAPGQRMVPLFGAPLADGLIAMTPTGMRAEVPAIAGPRAFALRVCRATLGGGLPGQSVVIVDPDRYPQAGGLALVEVEGGYRLVSVALDRHGAMRGYSVVPETEIALDPLPPGHVAAVVAALFV
ncbi:helix-turn-helix domain-containing protein [Sphingomonas abaci]|uniref:HTH cro/C1-type domain-containing protein n=1 Tax=Sphingomonas abaci TaxID=237611 RepID=A0A7W7AII9_9SPHN|nr:helix-turn-helix transcriptional regulator [Sphingomonas abaci]MBB4616677.1 hypothetical protein [Sphingomonas abaci]